MEESEFEGPPPTVTHEVRVPQDTAEKLVSDSLSAVVQDEPFQLSMNPPSVLSCPTAKQRVALGHDTLLNETLTPDDCGFATIDHDEPSHSSITPTVLERMPDPVELSPTAVQRDSEEHDTLLSTSAPPGSTRGTVLQVPALKMSEST
jgi:hypothetical protein